MIVHHERREVIGTPFGCAARLEQLTSRASGVEIVEGVGRYSMEVPARFSDYRPRIAVRNPYERAVLLYLWAHKRMSDMPEVLGVQAGENFPKYINRIQGMKRNTRAYLRRRRMSYLDLPRAHPIWLTRSVLDCYIQLGNNMRPKPGQIDCVRLDDLSKDEWVAEEPPYGVPVDLHEWFWREKQGELLLNVGTARVANWLWASEECCFVGGYAHLGDWEDHHPSCNVKHKSEVK